MGVLFMLIKPADKRKLIAIISIALGVLLLMFIVPFWAWLAALGMALIIIGLVIFFRKC